MLRVVFHKAIVPALIAMMLALAVPQMVVAQEWVIFTGINDFDQASPSDRLVVGVEYHALPFAMLGWADLSLVGALVGHGNGDYWIGGGVAAMMPLRDRWFVEASVMPGVYDAANLSTSLGSNFEIRSLIGVGRRLNDRTSLSLAITHKSNAGTSRINPGVNAVSLRLRRSF